jgi:signal transduction histidine kinase
MKQFYLRLPFKAFVFFLAVLLGTSCLGGWFFVLYMGDQGYYRPNTTDYKETLAYDEILRSHADAALSAYVRDAGLSGAQWVFSGESVNLDHFTYEIFRASEPDQVLDSRGDPGNRPWDGEEQIDFGYYSDEYDNNGYRIYIGDLYIIRYSVPEPFPENSSFNRGQQVFDRLFPYRYDILAGTAAALVLFLLCAFFLVRAAGRRPGMNEITLNPVHRIPLDVFLAAAGTFFVLLVFLIEFDLRPAFSYNALYYSLYYGFYYILSRFDMIVIYSAAAVFLILIVPITFAARVRAGQWRRNTVICRVLNLAGRSASAAGRLLAPAVRSVPLFWKLPLTFFGVQLINFLLAMLILYNRHTGGEEIMLFMFLGFLCNLAALLLVCYIGMCMQQLKEAGKRLAEGDLSGGADTKRLRLDFLEHANHLNAIGEGMTRAVEQRIRGERLKTELITNVSHDIKTPLTSIVNYVDLLGKEALPERALEYVAVLERQAGRLSRLTDDLIEASKASTGNVQLNLQKTGLCELVNQAVGEYAERLEARELEPVVSATAGAEAEEAYVMADGRHLWRVMDNLLSNVCKYSQPGTRVYVDVRSENGGVTVTFKNISRERLNIDSQDLTERFVRGDSARSAEGSGLGLNIARSLVELQRGIFALSIDGDLFKAELRFPAAG